MSAVTVDMLVASDAAASGLSHSHADARPATADDDEDSFEQLFEQLRVMKGLVTVLFVISLIIVVCLVTLLYK